ncbi:hypothetical protein ILUMI_10980 [Ignelater luminosus]|uniref:Uncharacterized protein n=1 Tax=Ignelater luminosus TaxID=2038154 RepID=A0A8K0D2X9_IGNLU|nr:hypothetical protein ILUMI_10980 [Ignelater luminosus]
MQEAMIVVNENNISIRNVATRYNKPYPTLRKHIVRGSLAKKLGYFMPVFIKEQGRQLVEFEKNGISNCDIDVFSDNDFAPSSVTKLKDSDEILEAETLDVLPDMNTKRGRLSHTPPLDAPTPEFVFHNTENESQAIEQDLSTVVVPYTSSTSDPSTSGLVHSIASISTTKYLTTNI